MNKTLTSTTPDTVADLLRDLGDISPERVRMRPAPGTATLQDLLDHNERKRGPLCELVDGALVEKVMGYPEGMLAIWLGHLLYEFMGGRDLGEIAGADAGLRLRAGLVRLPDVSFIRRERIPAGATAVPVPALTPCLAVEVLSPSNTAGEMARKREEYFRNGTDLVWQIDPRTREIEVFTAPDVGTVLREGDTLDGGSVLPGLALPVARVFERLPTP
jgi:Uma2 family endonuclease